jgi:hypothetical protein
MPDMIPVATQIQPPDPNKGLSMLSSIVGLRQQQQNLQTGAINQATALAQSQQEQQKNQELQRAQQLAIQGAKGGKYTKDDGSLDRTQLANDISAIGPYAQAMSGQLLSQAHEVIANQQAHQNLTVDRKKEIGATFASLAADPQVDNTKFIDAVERLRQAHKDDPEFSRMLTSMTTHYPGTASAEQQRQLLSRWSAAATGEPQTTPGTIDTGAEIKPGAVNKFGGGFTPQGAAIPKQLPPQIVTAPTTGGQAVVGGAAGTQPQPIGGPAVGGNPWQPYPGQKNDIETYRGEVQNVRAEAQQAPLARNINQQILRLTQDAKTGPGSDTWQHVIGAVGAPFGLSPTASYQEVGKFLEKNAIASMQAMGGPPSDSRLEAAAKANGSTSFSPEALRTVTKFNDATTTALDQYRQGIDHAVGVGQNVDYTKLPEFKASWAKNFDVNVFRVENAIRDHDTEELGKIKKELGASGLKSLAEKRKNLQLLTQGNIP